MTRLKLSVPVLVALCVFASRESSGRLVREGTVCVYDANTTVTFEDVGRVETEHSVSFGESLIFHAWLNGEPHDVGPISTKLPLMQRMSSEIQHIQFADSERIWVLSSLGKDLGLAALLNLRTGKIEREYRGVRFSISSDGSSIAYAYRMGRKGFALFTDDVMFYPRLEDGFVIAGPTQPMKSDGRRAGELINWQTSLRRSQLLSPLTWETSDTVTALVAEISGSDESTSVCSVVSLAKLRRDSRGLTTGSAMRRVLGPGDALAMGAKLSAVNNEVTSAARSRLRIPSSR